MILPFPPLQSTTDLAEHSGRSSAYTQRQRIRCRAQLVCIGSTTSHTLSLQPLNSDYVTLRQFSVIAKQDARPSEEDASNMQDAEQNNTGGYDNASFNELS
jgi:hypothetical protein